MQAEVKLRGHHLLCILPYIGAGYTPDFIDHFDDAIARLNRGARIRIVRGPDSLCASLRRGGMIFCEHAKTCRKASVRNRDALALKDISRVLRRKPLKIGDVFALTRKDIRYLRKLFAFGAIRRACTSCPWHGFCSTIADKNFAGTKLVV